MSIVYSPVNQAWLVIAVGLNRLVAVAASREEAEQKAEDWIRGER